jgi:hypothetical protein
MPEEEEEVNESFESAIKFGGISPIVSDVFYTCYNF